MERWAMLPDLAEGLGSGAEAVGLSGAVCPAGLGCLAHAGMAHAGDVARLGGRGRGSRGSEAGVAGVADGSVVDSWHFR